VKIITFPKAEWADIQARLASGLELFTLRVALEFDKYAVGEELVTEWGEKVRVIKKETVTGGVEELKLTYKYFNQLTAPMLKDMEGYDEIDILTLVPLKK